MFSRHEASQIRQEFWTKFGQYMLPVTSAEGERINWINYKTGEKFIAFKMQAHNRMASIAVEITHPDDGIRQLYFEQFMQLKTLLENALGEEWIWNQDHHTDTGKTISRIYTELQGKSVLNNADWPYLISFFKPRIIALDEFWSTARHAFEMLR